MATELNPIYSWANRQVNNAESASAESGSKFFSGKGKDYLISKSKKNLKLASLHQTPPEQTFSEESFEDWCIFTVTTAKDTTSAKTITTTTADITKAADTAAASAEPHNSLESEVSHYSIEASNCNSVIAKDALNSYDSDTESIREGKTQKRKGASSHAAFLEQAKEEFELTAEDVQKAYLRAGLNSEKSDELKTVKFKLLVIKELKLPKEILLIELKRIAKQHIPTLSEIDVKAANDETNQKLLRKITLKLHPDMYRESAEAATVADFCFKEFISLFEYATSKNENDSSITLDPNGIYLHQQVPYQDILEIYQGAFKPQKLSDIKDNYSSASRPSTATLYRGDAQFREWSVDFETFYENIKTSHETQWLIRSGIMSPEDLSTFSESQWQCFYVALKQSDAVFSQRAHPKFWSSTHESIFLSPDENFHCFEQFFIHWLVGCNKPELLDNLLNNSDKIPKEYKLQRRKHQPWDRAQYHLPRDNQPLINCSSYCVDQMNANVDISWRYRSLDNHDKQVTPLMRACSLNNIRCAQILLKHKAPVKYIVDTNRGNSRVSYTALHLVQSPEMLLSFIEAGVDLNAPNSEGRSFLHFIAAGKEPVLYKDTYFDRMANFTFNYESLVSKLHSAGADLALQDKHGNTPFHLACANGNIAFVIDTLLTMSKSTMRKQLLDQEYEPQKPSMPESQAMVSAKSQNEESVSITRLCRSQHRWLLERRNHNGEQPIHLAVKNQKLELIQVLAAAGCNFNARDKYGNLPVQSAMYEVLAGDVFAHKERDKQQNITLWLMRHIISGDSQKFEEMMEELLIDPLKVKGIFSEHEISLQQIKDRFRLFCKKARNEREYAQVPKNCELKIKLTESDEQRIEAFVDINEKCRKLVESTETEYERKRLDKMLDVYPAGLSAFDEQSQTEDELGQPKKARPMVTHSDEHPVNQAKKGMVWKALSSDSVFDQNLSQLAKLPKKEVRHWIYRFNCRIAHRPPQHMLTASGDPSLLAIRSSGKQPLAIEEKK
ncbi:hypothetical protein SOPP22_08390 [Shewanella sp. OPT22]|nr:hypothetical protein SOPP22_08390 [Shewanella sp. OPT22]